MSLGMRLLGELFRGNGIHHADSCKSRQPFLGPTRGTTSMIDAYESPTGEVTYTCTECGRLARWKDRVLQPDPIWELEHARVRGPGEQEQAVAAAELQRLQQGQVEDPKGSRPHEPPQPQGPGRRRASGLRIANAKVLIDEFRRLKLMAGQSPSQEQLAEALGVVRTTLRNSLERFGLDWPPE
jgi:hypothetical protein